MNNDIDTDAVARAVKRLRAWMVWAQTHGVPHPYYDATKTKQDNSQVMRDQLDDLRAVCAAAEWVCAAGSVLVTEDTERAKRGTEGTENIQSGESGDEGFPRGSATPRESDCIKQAEGAAK